MAAPTLQDMAAQDAASLKEHSDAQTAEQAKQTFGSSGQPNGILSWMTQMPKRITSDMIDSAVRAADSMAHDGSWGEAAVRAGRDVATGVADAAASTGKAVVDFSEALDTGRAEKDYAETGGKGMSQIEQQRALEAQDPAMAARDRAMGDDAETLDYGQNPIWNHARSAIMDFRDAVAVKDPNLVDGLTQSVAQLAIPFAGYSKALSGVHDAAIAAQGLEDISATQGFGSYLMKTAQKDLTGLATKVVAPGAVTDATALQPHSMRFADLIALGRHTEGKLGDVLQALAPDGSAQDAYIRYLTDRGDEGEAEGRFKNVLDGFGANLLATPLITAAGSVLKQGTAGLRYLVDNGVPSSGDIVGIRPQMQRGGPRALANNASGESSASQEAVNRVVAEKNAGLQRFRIDPDGIRTPLTGVDAVDVPAPKGHIHTLRDEEGNEVITDRGGLPAAHARGLLARAGLPAAALAATTAGAANAPLNSASPYPAVPDWNAQASKYSTPIPPDKRAAYEEWKAKLAADGHDMSGRDYDMPGAFLAGIKPAANGHFDDQFKKPNEWTFSTDSKYSGHGYTGGVWSQAKGDGAWTFRASPDNLKFHTAEDLIRYFRKYEPESTLYLPGQKKPAYAPPEKH